MFLEKASISQAWNISQMCNFHFSYFSGPATETQVCNQAACSEGTTLRGKRSAVQDFGKSVQVRAVGGAVRRRPAPRHTIPHRRPPCIVPHRTANIHVLQHTQPLRKKTVPTTHFRRRTLSKRIH